MNAREWILTLSCERLRSVSGYFLACGRSIVTPHRDGTPIVICYCCSLSLLSIRAPESPVPDMALATSTSRCFPIVTALLNTVITVGSAVVIVFGTQRVCRRPLGYL